METAGGLNIQVSGGDPYAAVCSLVDAAFMGFYLHVRRNTKRITRLLVAFLPLMMLLVGSCKTSEVVENIIGEHRVAQFRAALFPDQSLTGDADYHPASGYVARARDYVENDPASLMRLTQSEVGYLFGKPTMQRKDADAKIWQYKTKSCVVDFFFYDDKAIGGDAPVSYVDFRLKADLEPGSAARMDGVSEGSQTKCIEKIVSGDSFGFNG